MSVVRVLFGIVVLVVIVLVNTIVVMWVERKVLGHMQGRLGPMRTGWHGLAQPFADALKLLGKEDIVPAAADRALFLVAPLIAFTPSVLLYAATPWVQQVAGFSFDTGIFLVFAVTAVFPVAILTAGWASHNKYALIGGFRSAAQQISYEVPMILAAMGVVVLAGSMRLSDIVAAQSVVWNVVTQPLGALLFFISLLAEINRTPFDLPEAESELVAGFNTEYSSMRFALFFVAEYANVFTWSLLATLLFLGGWNGPLLPGFVWLLAKTYAMIFLVIWVRATFPRVRVDQLMAFSWKLLIPAALVNAFVAAAGVFAGTLPLIALEVAATAVFAWIVARIGRTAGDRLRDAEVAARGLRTGSPDDLAAFAADTLASPDAEGVSA